MPFDLRCPKCKAKLRFDEPPPKGEIVECGKCEHSFSSPTKSAYTEAVNSTKLGTSRDAATATKAKPEVAVAEPKKPKAYIQKERVHFNPLILLLIVGSLMLTLILGLFVPWKLFIESAAQTQGIVASIPDNYNVIRGVNTKAMRNVPKVKGEQDKYFDAGAVAVFKDVGAKVGAPNETDLIYFVLAREPNGSSPSLYYFLFRKVIDREALGDGLAMTAGGKPVYAKALSSKLVVVALNERGGGAGNAQAVVGNVAAKFAAPGAENMNTAIGNSGARATRGQVWAIYRNLGTLKDYIGESVAVIEGDTGMSELVKACKASKLFCTWTSFGGQGVRFGTGLELGTAEEAKSLVKNLKEGPMGKGDESEVPNKLRQAASYVDPKQNGEFLQYLDYRNDGQSAYLITKIENPDKARQSLDGFNSMARGYGQLAGGGGGFGPVGPYGR